MELRKLVTTFSLAAVVIIIGIFLLNVVIFTKVATVIEKDGLKGVVEQVWEGNQNGK